MATSSSSVQPILDAALVNYRKQTKVDLTNHPSAEKLQNCSLDDVLQLLLERESAFNVYRDKHRKLIDSLRPIVQAIHALTSILGEAAGLVRDQHHIFLEFPYSFASLQVPFQPTKLIFAGIDVLLSVRVTLLPMGLLCAIHPRQAAVGVGESYDALSDVFERVANFLARFRVYTEKIPPSPMMSNIMVQIMTEVLNVLALATKHIKQGRISKWPIVSRTAPSLFLRTYFSFRTHILTASLYGKYWLCKLFCHVPLPSLVFHYLLVSSATFRYIYKDLLEHSGSFRSSSIYTVIVP